MLRASRSLLSVGPPRTTALLEDFSAALSAHIPCVGLGYGPRPHVPSGQRAAPSGSRCGSTFGVPRTREGLSLCSRGFAASTAEQIATSAPGKAPKALNEHPQYSVVGQVEGEYEVNPANTFAVVEVGPHQFKVTAGDIVITEKLTGVDVDDKLSLKTVLMLGSTTETIVGRPYVPDAYVVAAVEEQFLDAKKMIFKFRRRKNSKRLKGHRQPLTSLRILEVHGISDVPAAALS
mmetsp:Transcript_10609/g.30206  ORF Transcript_10609/g.30206 Transcript_10609/m.30206 type:complete len:234 (-) Transcript_10609:75-776(-)